MKTSWVSTHAFTEATRRSVLDMQAQLLRSQKEMASGRLADPGLTLGNLTARTVNFRNDHARLSAIIDTNGLVSGRLDAAQSALAGIGDIAQDFLNSLSTAYDGSADPGIIRNKAENALKGLVSSLNVSVSGEYLFAGINSDVTPVGDYYGTPTSDARQALGDAFEAHFGFPRSDPQAAAITPTAMETFLDTAFADLFSDTEWSADWSSASSQNVRSRVSPGELLTTGTNANEPAFRKLAQAFAMVADLGFEGLNAETRKAVIHRAMTEVGQGIGELTQVRATLGSSQQQVSRASERMSVQIDILNTQINELEAVDPYEAASRVSTLLSQLETSYALTARIQDLTLLKYL